MATRQGQALGRLAVAPAVAALAAWSIVPLALAFYYAFLHYRLDDPDNTFFAHGANFYYFVTDPFFAKDLINTILLVLFVLAVTIVGGVGLALLLDRPFWGRGIVRVLVISPFFVMSTVSSLVWKNLMMHPVYGFLAHIWRSVGLTPVDWFGSFPLLSVVIVVSWQWLPFATLILLTALQSLDEEQKDAAEMDGAGNLDFFRYIVLPHLTRPITVVILIETIFLLNVFAEIKVTSVGGLAGNLTYLVFSQLNDANDVGEAAAGGLIAVVLANFVAAFLVRLIGRNLED
jgi:sorbitol/mannitol transport system permease protein